MEARRLFAVDLLFDAAGLSATESVTVNGVAYFFADNAVTGRELWKSDGFPGGTVLVKDLTPGPSGTTLVSMSQAAGRAVFVTVADERSVDGAHSADYTVWSSDGTADGTVVLAQFDDAFNISIRQLGDGVAFAVSRPSAITVDGARLNDALLYFTDGTPATTRLVKTFLADAANPMVISYDIAKMHVAGERIVFTPDGMTLWSTDGTAAGMVDLTDVFGPSGLQFFASVSNIAEAGVKVIIPGQLGGNVWITDGTVAGTVSHPLGVTGVIQERSALVVGAAYYFIEVFNDTKTLWRLDVDSAELTVSYRIPSDASGNHLAAIAAGERLVIFDTEIGGEFGSIWVTDGTAAPATQLVDMPAQGGLFSPVVLDGLVYFVVLSGGYDPDMEGIQSGFVGSRVSNPGLGGREVNSEDYTLQLWRSDGTAEGTGVVRTLYDGVIDGHHVLLTLAAAEGLLLVRTEVATGIEPNVPWSENSLTQVSDETVAYDPRDLSLARSGASVKVVNGVLRLGGSMGPDTFRLYRRAEDPSELVVEYSGYTRIFAYSSIRRIVADLQDGDDHFEIVEHTPGEFRLWTSVLGGGGADRIIGSTGRDTIFGGLGNDFIRSRGNKDFVNGGAGRDHITGGEGDDVLAGGGGRDLVLANAGNDVLFGQDAVERALDLRWEDGDVEEDLLLRSL